MAVVCDSHPPEPAADSGPGRTPPSLLTRRTLLAAGAVAAGAAIVAGSAPAAGAPVAPTVFPVQVMPGLFITPRNAWGWDLPPKGPLLAETVQFLLVHHTASANVYKNGAKDVLRSTYYWHTSAAKGWPDVCYQFFVDHDGVIYEGRAGALDGPVRADATGGSQGFAQLVCLVGDFTVTDPPPAMVDSLIRVLAWLAVRYGIDTSPGATTSFVSRGSQKFKAGVAVTTPTIGGHRDMSYTTCPGDRVYTMIGSIREQVHAQRAAWQSGALWQAERLGP